MNQECISGLSQAWKELCLQYDQTVLLSAQKFIADNIDHLVTAFYEQMIKEPASAEFFSDNIIQDRLIITLRQWLLETFMVALKGQFDSAVQRQLKVGHVHARVGIPSWLIMRGVREIELQVFQLLKGQEKAEILEMCGYIVRIMSFSTEIMCRSYEDKTEKHQEAKHSYRLFSAMQEAAVHKDKQRGALLDWENELMFKIFSGNLKFKHILFSKSEFGLWFIHKASYAFSGSDQAQLIIQRIYQVDALTEEAMDCGDKNQLWSLIQNIRTLNREIQHLIDQLFQVAEYIESGNDALTQLLNRRYLNTILSREISYSRKKHSPLALLAMDADYFKAVNDTYGHTAGDEALKFIGEVIQKYSKGSDYAFRVGGEEFLLLLVDCDTERAQHVAECIRSEIENGRVKSAQGQIFGISISIGCAQFDGHPDYQKFLDAADSALYVAKNNGRNCVFSADF